MPFNCPISNSARGDKLKVCRGKSSKLISKLFPWDVPTNRLSFRFTKNEVGKYWLSKANSILSLSPAKAILTFWFGIISTVPARIGSKVTSRTAKLFNLKFPFRFKAEGVPVNLPLKSTIPATKGLSPVLISKGKAVKKLCTNGDCKSKLSARTFRFKLDNWGIPFPWNSTPIKPSVENPWVSAFLILISRPFQLAIASKGCLIIGNSVSLNWPNACIVLGLKEAIFPSPVISVVNNPRNKGIFSACCNSPFWRKLFGIWDSTNWENRPKAIWSPLMVVFHCPCRVSPVAKTIPPSRPKFTLLSRKAIKLLGEKLVRFPLSFANPCRNPPWKFKALISATKLGCKFAKGNPKLIKGCRGIWSVITWPVNWLFANCPSALIIPPKLPKLTCANPVAIRLLRLKLVKFPLTFPSPFKRLLRKSKVWIWFWRLGGKLARGKPKLIQGFNWISLALNCPWNCPWFSWLLAVTIPPNWPKLITVFAFPVKLLGLKSSILPDRDPSIFKVPWLISKLWIWEVIVSVKLAKGNPILINRGKDKLSLEKSVCRSPFWSWAIALIVLFWKLSWIWLSAFKLFIEKFCKFADNLVAKFNWPSVKSIDWICCLVGSGIVANNRPKSTKGVRESWLAMTSAFQIWLLVCWAIIFRFPSAILICAFAVFPEIWASPKIG